MRQLSDPPPPLATDLEELQLEALTLSRYFAFIDVVVHCFCRASQPPSATRTFDLSEHNIILNGSK